MCCRPYGAVPRRVAPVPSIDSSCTRARAKASHQAQKAQDAAMGQSDCSAGRQNGPAANMQVVTADLAERFNMLQCICRLGNALQLRQPPPHVEDLVHKRLRVKMRQDCRRHNKHLGWQERCTSRDLRRRSCCVLGDCSGVIPNANACSSVCAVSGRAKLSMSSVAPAAPCAG